MTNSVINSAKAYARLGLHVFPVEVYQSDGRWQKAPLTGHGFKDASDRMALVVPMFMNARPYRGGYLAVGCWPGPSGYVVLDVDVKDGASGREDLADLIDRYGNFIEGAPEVITISGGSHFWFRRPEGVTIDNTNLTPGIEVRCDNGFVVLPEDAGGAGA